MKTGSKVFVVSEALGCVEEMLQDRLDKWLKEEGVLCKPLFVVQSECSYAGTGKSVTLIIFYSPSFLSPKP